ncbi:mitotic-spindle organizing protein 1A-like [Rutidosis leptorrhynchoides]|uniref:mitotic-spindle organizing protein 1A-like n=1 Tax=Rutidosis leptorrhynchoides TaxID=125765 RepID=UPI003A99F245
MNTNAAQTARESLELVFQMSNILDTGLDRHAISVLIALCDLGLNPEALAAVVKEFCRDSPSNTRCPQLHRLIDYARTLAFP